MVLDLVVVGVTLASLVVKAILALQEVKVLDLLAVRAYKGLLEALDLLDHKVTLGLLAVKAYKGLLEALDSLVVKET